MGYFVRERQFYRLFSYCKERTVNTKEFAKVGMDTCLPLEKHKLVITLRQRKFIGNPVRIPSGISPSGLHFCAPIMRFAVEPKGSGIVGVLPRLDEDICGVPANLITELLSFELGRSQDVNGLAALIIYQGCRG